MVFQDASLHHYDRPCSSICLSVSQSRIRFNREIYLNFDGKSASPYCSYQDHIKPNHIDQDHIKSDHMNGDYIVIQHDYIKQGRTHWHIWHLPRCIAYTEPVNCDHFHLPPTSGQSTIRKIRWAVKFGFSGASGHFLIPSLYTEATVGIDPFGSQRLRIREVLAS